MKGIVAVDKNWGIGKDNQLLVSIPDDMKFFRQTTSGKVVLMGRKTLDSFPSGKPLPKRVNICLTGDPSFEREGVIVVHNIEEALEVIKEYNSNDVFCIGGASIYQQFLSYMDEIYVTRIDHAYEADAHFPDLDKNPEWTMSASSDELHYEDLSYKFTSYKRC